MLNIVLKEKTMEAIIDHSASKLGLVKPRKHLFIRAYAKLPIISATKLAQLPEGIWVYYEGHWDEPKTPNCLVFAFTSKLVLTRAFFTDDNYTLFAGNAEVVNGISNHIFRLVPASHAEVLAEAYEQSRPVELYHKNATEYYDMKIILSTKQESRRR